MTPALTALVLQLVELGIQVAPSVIAAARTEIALVSGGAAPTAEQQASIDAAFEAVPREPFVPDLVFIRDGDEPVYLEMLGYWTPRSLNERLKEFARAGFENYAIAASEEMRCSRDAPSQLPPNVIVYKKTLNARELQARLARLTEISA